MKYLCRLLICMEMILVTGNCLVYAEEENNKKSSTELPKKGLPGEHNSNVTLSRDLIQATKELEVAARRLLELLSLRSRISQSSLAVSSVERLQAVVDDVR